MDEKTGKREITVREITLHTLLAKTAGRLIYEDTLGIVAVGDKAYVVSFFDTMGQPINHYFKDRSFAIKYAKDWSSGIVCPVNIILDKGGE